MNAVALAAVGKGVHGAVRAVRDRDRRCHGASGRRAWDCERDREGAADSGEGREEMHISGK